MKVLVCGGRDYTDSKRVASFLDALHASSPIHLVIHGGAHGADTLANDWALARNVHTCTVNALWSQHGKSAGPKRNDAMLQLLPHYVVAFPGGRGTADMVKRAKQAGLKVVEVGS